MKKRVVIVHGWEGHPNDAWIPWLKNELETRGFEVHVPEMPDTDSPRISNWVPALTKAVGRADEQTYFVGHSMGCQTIARYLENLPPDQNIGGAVFVAGFFKRLTGLEDESGNQETVDHWLNSPIDLKKVHEHLPKSVAIFSDDDPYVPLDNQNDFREKLYSQIIIVPNMGHFSTTNNTTRLPIALDSLLEIAND